MSAKISLDARYLKLYGIKGLYLVDHFISFTSLIFLTKL